MSVLQRLLAGLIGRPAYLVVNQPGFFSTGNDYATNHQIRARPPVKLLNQAIPIRSKVSDG